MNYIQIVFEILVALGVVSLQVHFFILTLKNINELSDYFVNAEDSEAYSLSSDHYTNSYKQIRIENSYSKGLQSVITSINNYLKKNSGTADYSIIKSIIEGDIEAKENHISTIISLPLYIGLMGTFFGVIIGLFNIAFRGGVNEQNINTFIGGVLIAMIASFCGLILTVWNNSKNYKEAKAICNERKNQFDNFLKVELLPYIGNSLMDTLERLKTNINDFNNKFENNIKLFDTKFSDNIKSLGNSVQNLSENINLVVENTNTQKEFLVQLKTMGYNRMAEANIKVFQLLKETGPTFIKFIESQKELTETVEHANQFVEIIESILDRIKTFEDSINNLGVHIDSNKFLGNEILKRIDINLNYLDVQFELLKQHEQKSSADIEDFFKMQYQRIQKLADQIKKEIEEALNFNISINPLLKLNLLENIDNKLIAIDKKIILNSEFKEINDNLLSTKNEVKIIKEKIDIAVQQLEKNRDFIPPNKPKEKKKPPTQPSPTPPPPPPKPEGTIRRIAKFLNINRGR